MSPIKVVQDRDRNCRQEAIDLDAFCRAQPELQFAQDCLVAETRRRVRAGTFSLAEAQVAWRMVYDKAGALWKQRYGYVPLSKARALAATNRAMIEKVLVVVAS